MTTLGLSLPPSKPKMLIRSIDIQSWLTGISMFDGINPVKVAKHKGNPSMVWLFTVERWGDEISCVTRLNGVVVQREVYDQRMTL